MSQAQPTASQDGATGEDTAQHALPSPLLHDLRTPLNQIIGYAEMLEEQTQEEGRDDFVADLHKVRAAGRHLLRLINDGFLPLQPPAAPGLRHRDRRRWEAGIGDGALARLRLGSARHHDAPDGRLRSAAPAQGRRVAAPPAGDYDLGPQRDGFRLGWAPAWAKKRSHDRERRLFAQLQENYGRLQELEKMRDDLTHMIVHDLRTPLSSLLAGLQTMPLLAPLAPEHKECYNIALRGGGTLLSMINDLLDISKMESGTFALELSPLSIPALLQESMEQIASSTRDKNLSLVRQAEPSLPLLLADGDKLRRILVNLLGNAQKFTPGAAPSPSPPSAPRTGQGAGESILFSISDTGEGIPPEAFAHLREVWLGRGPPGRTPDVHRPGPDVL